MSSDSPCKDDNARYKTVTLKLKYDNKVEDVFVFLTRKVFNSDNFSIAFDKHEI